MIQTGRFPFHYGFYTNSDSNNYGAKNAFFAPMLH
jgi:hypothetical protein|eukprot:COSAG06_NODE_564_length_14246_cov_9.566693_2_plen_35_part_00